MPSVQWRRNVSYVDSPGQTALVRVGGKTIDADGLLYTPEETEHMAWTEREVDTGTFAKLLRLIELAEEHEARERKMAEEREAHEREISRLQQELAQGPLQLNTHYPTCHVL